MLSINNKKNPIKLILTPADKSSGLRPVTITTPVFEIGKTAPFISKYEKTYAHEVSCLSRKHASIHFEKNQYQLRDLGSTNGTLKNDVMVSEGQPVALNDGDTVTFGNRLFSYKISLDKARKQEKPKKKKTEARQTPSDTAAPGPATAYIGKSSVDDIIGQIINDESGSSFDIEDLDQKSKDRVSESPIKRFALPLLGGFALLVIGLGLLTFLYLSRNSEFNQVETMLAEKQYDPALLLSTQNLLTIEPGTPSVTRFENYAQEAFIGLVTPSWLEMTNGEDYDTAKMHPWQILEQRQQTSAPHLAIIGNLLTWIADLFQEKQRGVSASVYQSNSSAQAVADKWNTSKGSYLALMRRIEGRNADFAPVHSKVVSSIRDLQIQLDEISFGRDSVLDTAKRYLNQPDDALLGQLKSIAAENPEVLETDRLHNELDRYAATFSEARQGCFGLALALSGSAFEHPLIVDKIDALQNRAFDTPGDLVQTQRALIEWRQGNVDTARELLVTARCNPISGRNTTAEIERMDAIVRLLQGGSDEDMLSAYQLFDEQYDSYFLERHRDRITDTRQKAADTLQSLTTNAVEQFTAYQINGGISASMRISTSLTQSFQTQAALLATALQSSTSAENIARVIGTDMQPQIVKAFGEIKDEVDNQTGFLEELRGSFANRDLLDQKIALLRARE